MPFHLAVLLLLIGLPKSHGDGSLSPEMVRTGGEISQILGSRDYYSAVSSGGDSSKVLDARIDALTSTLQAITDRELKTKSPFLPGDARLYWQIRFWRVSLLSALLMAPDDESTSKRAAACKIMVEKAISLKQFVGWRPETDQEGFYCLDLPREASITTVMDISEATVTGQVAAAKKKFHPDEK